MDEDGYILIIQQAKIKTNKNYKDGTNGFNKKIAEMDLRKVTEERRPFQNTYLQRIIKS